MAGREPDVANLDDAVRGFHPQEAGHATRAAGRTVNDRIEQRIVRGGATFQPPGELRLTAKWSVREVRPELGRVI